MPRLMQGPSNYETLDTHHSGLHDESPGCDYSPKCSVTAPPKLSFGATRVTDETTGGQKDAKLEDLGQIDPHALRILAKVAAMGGEKYSRGNFMKGYAWSLNFAAMNRHMLAFWEGEDVDPESGLSHMAHAAWHALALVTFSTRDLGTDDRYQRFKGDV